MPAANISKLSDTTIFNTSPVSQSEKPSSTKDDGNVIFAGSLPSSPSPYRDSAELPLDMKDYLLKMKSYSDALSNSVSLLMLKEANESYEKIKAKSDKEDGLTVRTKPDEIKETAKSPEPITITIDSIAASHKSESKSMDSFSYDFEAKKTYDFNIKKKEELASFSIEAKSSDYNKRILRKLASEINGSGIGIHAAVQNNKNSSSLSLESQRTGTEQSFSTSGSLATALEMRVSREASDAVYSINNGEPQTSPSNNLKISRDLTVQLKKAEDNPVIISFNKDTVGAKNSLRQLVNNYNSLLAVSDKNPGFGKLYNQLTTLTSSYEASLTDAGIYVQKDGNLSLDEIRVDKGITNGSLSALFTGSKNEASFGQKLVSIAEKADSDPAAYVNNEQSGRAKDRKVNMDYVNALDKYDTKGMLINNII